MWYPITLYYHTVSFLKTKHSYPTNIQPSQSENQLRYTLLSSFVNCPYNIFLLWLRILSGIYVTFNCHSSLDFFSLSFSSYVLHSFRKQRPYILWGDPHFRFVKFSSWSHSGLAFLAGMPLKWCCGLSAFHSSHLMTDSASRTAVSKTVFVPRFGWLYLWTYIPKFCWHD